MSVNFPTQEDTPNNKIPWKDHCDRIVNNYYPSTIENKHMFIKWFMSKEHLGWSFDGTMIVRLYMLWKEKIQKENDVVVVICGREGNGKSTLAMQIASWFDDGLNNDHIVLNREQLEQEWIKNYPSKSVITDEGGFMMFSRNAMMPENKEVLQAFMLLRQYRMINIICCPQYGSIDSTMRNERCHLLINVTSRGEYQAYFGRDLDKVNSDLNKRKIKLQFIRVSMKHSWTGRFNRFKPKCINEEKYLEKKRAHGDSFLKELIDRRMERLRKQQEKNEKKVNNGVLEAISQESEGFGEHHKPYPLVLVENGAQNHLQMIKEALNGRVDTNGG